MTEEIVPEPIENYVTMSDGIFLASLIGSYPQPQECPRLANRYNTIQNLKRADECIKSGVPYKVLLGENQAYDAYANITSYLYEAKRVYVERLLEIPLWKKWIYYLKDLKSVKDMDDWFSRIPWGI